MDTIFEKLLETIKEKMSKKQVVAIVAIVTLYLLAAHPGYIAGVAFIEIIAQTYLDKGERSENSNDNVNVPAGD